MAARRSSYVETTKNESRHEAGLPSGSQLTGIYAFYRTLKWIQELPFRLEDEERKDDKQRRRRRKLL